ncbi:hypothetical protein H1230_10915 [Paenibacillus sp. 19GGS1-52]|uniref:hypothetical protein n=1 Tax=Paenibacillus sp. 19GGS1-52 TaxID=2758563 RepID=UPI001EFBEFA3|nr:hypothetical protein [Paenibacillus sp. 19GGS1-52]ULO09232.1 hypothetical protein H1230_10915 [Paenibacillus sp. 19GGS1-52]
MKILFLYFLLAFLGLSIIVIIDLLSGLSLSMSFHSIYGAFVNTNIQESILMVVFICLPFINAITDSFKKRKQRTK